MRIHQEEALDHFMEHLVVQCTLRQLLVVLQVAHTMDPIYPVDNRVTVEPQEAHKNLEHPVDHRLSMVLLEALINTMHSMEHLVVLNLELTLLPGSGRQEGQKLEAHH